jgi:phage-related protein
LPSPRELRPLELVDEECERSIEDCGVIAARNRVTQQILRLAKLALGVGVDRDSEQIPILGEWCDACAWWFRSTDCALHGHVG